MARCISCSAPLLANTNVCRYCGVRNDVDLRVHRRPLAVKHTSARICPACEKPLQTIEISLQKPLSIERCETCFGLFFDPGEIDILLEQSVSQVFEVNKQLLKSINKDRYQKKQVRYQKCPECRILMNRVNFGRHSGVVVDHCKKHGIWLESGEVVHLMEWKKAGGQVLQQQHKKDASARKPALDRGRPAQLDGWCEETHPDLFESVATVVFSLFK